MLKSDGLRKFGRLTSIGFSLAGIWKKTGNGITCELTHDFTQPNALYAFVIDGDVVYIGKTTITLRNRMQRYKTPPKTSAKGATTNIKINHLINEKLAQGKIIQVFALPDKGLITFGGFVVNLAAALEDSLVKDLKPIWNGGKKESTQETLEPAQ